MGLPWRGDFSLDVPDRPLGSTTSLRIGEALAVMGDASMPEQTAMYHFTVSPPRGPGQDDVATLLRQVADTLDALGAVTVHDITFHVDMTEDGSWPLMSVYYEVDVSQEVAAAGVDDALSGDDTGSADDSLIVIYDPDDDIEVIESPEVASTTDTDPIEGAQPSDDAGEVEPAREVAAYNDDERPGSADAAAAAVAALEEVAEAVTEAAPVPPIVVPPLTSAPPQTPQPPLPPLPPLRPAAYVDMIGAFTNEPASLHAVPAADDEHDEFRANGEPVEYRDHGERLAEVVSLGAAIEADRATSANAETETNADAEVDLDERDNAADPAADDVTEMSAAPLAPTFRTFDRTIRQPAAHIDAHLPESTNSSSTGPIPVWRAQLPVDRASLRRLKDLWRTNTRRRPGP
jgi:hypothetical protein